jgi:hypothetical protein
LCQAKRPGQGATRVIKWRVLRNGKRRNGAAAIQRGQLKKSQTSATIGRAASCNREYVHSWRITQAYYVCLYATVRRRLLWVKDLRQHKPSHKSSVDEPALRVALYSCSEPLSRRDLQLSQDGRRAYGSFGNFNPYLLRGRRQHTNHMAQQARRCQDSFGTPVPLEDRPTSSQLMNTS